MELCYREYSLELFGRVEHCSALLLLFALMRASRDSDGYNLDGIKP
jgi:hypothetical protein